MKLYDKQKKFDIKHFAKDLIAYHKPFYTNGVFLFNEKYLNIANNLPEFNSTEHWGLLNKTYQNTNPPDLHKLIAEFAPANPEDEKLIPCCMEPMLKGKNNFKLLCQQFSYEVDGEERIRYVNADFLQYINVKDCFFRTTAEPISPIIIYNIYNSELVGLIMPLT